MNSFVQKRTSREKGVNYDVREDIFLQGYFIIQRLSCKNFPFCLLLVYYTLR